MRTFYGWLWVVCAFGGCGADGEPMVLRQPNDAGGPSGGTNGGGTDDAGPEDSATDAGSGPLRRGLERDSTVGGVGTQFDRLRDANQVMSLLVKQDPTLDLSASACDNAKNVAARANGAVSSANTSCAKAEASCLTSAATVSATFTACSVGETGNVVSGTVTATVSKTTVNGVTTLMVQATLKDVTVTTSDGNHALKGTLSTSTSDLKTYALTADLVVDSYTITFKGTSLATESAAGDLEGVTLDGTGTVSGPSMTEMMGDATCTASSLAYTAVGLHRSFAVCRADAGTVTLSGSYTCTTTITTRGKPRTTTTTALVQDIVMWDPDTATTGNVHVKTSTTVNGQTTVAEKDVALPGECK